MEFPWATTLPPADEAVQAGLRRMAASLALAKALTAAGRTLELTGLDATAGLLCAQVLDLDPRQAVGLRPSLLALDASAASLLALLRANRPSSGTPPSGKRPNHAARLQ